ncbi:MAG: iron-containing alcohol dehydrogenase [Verrucomicrobia bacterium]|nr:iron-containing alcohol dehydrogenase [Verrucomicrobiota bacterium]
MMPTFNFEFATAGKILFGTGSLNQIGDCARPLGSRVLLVTGRTSARADRARSLLESAGLGVVQFSVAGEPTVDEVAAGIEKARCERCDLVVGFGGGSALDTAKAVAVLTANGGAPLDYLEVVGRGRPITRPGVPCIAVPTTAGSGAEVTRNSVLAVPSHKVKASLRSEFLLPRVAIVDPELTRDLPSQVTAATGLDTLTQLIEPYVCVRANPFTDGFCVTGLRLVARSLRRAYENGQDISARQDMSLASLCSGIALANAGLGAVHGFAAPVGGAFPARHGAVCAALLPVVMEVNLRVLRSKLPDSPVIARYQQIAEILTGQAGASPEDGIAWVRDLREVLRIPGLSAHGITQADVPDLVEKAARASSMKANPAPLSREELQEILVKSL